MLAIRAGGLMGQTRQAVSRVPPLAQRVGVEDEDLVVIGAERLVRSLMAPGHGRDAITKWVGNDCPALFALTLVTSELLTNGVKHADLCTKNRWLDLRLLEGSDDFCVEVTDPGSQASLPYLIPFQSKDQSARMEGGRGLALVDKFSKGRWETYLVSGSNHRVVRCLISIDPSEDDIGLDFDLFSGFPA
ncbi:ATP-binding protein [Nonomuraea sp. NPDC059007]|uniref:ATP-binding protein n=1 Tax=Nonomuraea sp. NPDC059007 TaxID=3346692 RepID=UPI003673BCBC